MDLYNQCLILSIDGLIGENNLVSQDSWLDNSLILSKMKTFYKIRKKESSFDIFNYLKILSTDRKIYVLLIAEILYILNFKKKFSQKNVNRIINNYFKIVSLNMTKKNNVLILPEQIKEDQKYLTTLALCNLYTISQFYNYEQQI